LLKSEPSVPKRIFMVYLLDLFSFGEDCSS